MKNKEHHVSLSRCKVDGNVIYLPNINEAPISNYANFKSMLIKAGGKYAKNSFVFKSDAAAIVAKLMDGEVVNIKKETQFYPTPASVVDIMIKAACIQPDEVILEPSAGQGAIVDGILASYPNNGIFICEKDLENSKVLENKYSDRSNVYNIRLFPNGDFLDFGSCKINPDKIIANPPFSGNQDIDHVMKMYEVLKPGGKIVSIMSRHWVFANGKKEDAFRIFIKSVSAEVSNLPKGSFKESGTNVDTVMVVIDKPI